MDPTWLSLLALGIGFALDFRWGDPAWIPHPIVGYGKLIAGGERLLNRGPAAVRFLTGALLTATLVGGAYLVTREAQHWARAISPWLALPLEATFVFLFLAHRTLVEEGRLVFQALQRSLPEGRRQVARIVGRDTQHLTAAQVKTAACETLAENLSDGVVAPLYAYALAGLPGMAAYKMINTLDSMIGHHDARFEWFGKVAARLDDLANLLPARLTGLWIALGAGSRRAWRYLWRYGHAHASPNAGYPEAALAGVLDTQVGGSLLYAGEWVHKPVIGDRHREIPDDAIALVVRVQHRAAFLALATTILLFPWINFT